MKSIVYSCVYEPAPKYAVQLRIWLATIVELAGVARSDVVVHLVEGADVDGTAAFLDAEGIRHRTIARFGDGTYCNKLGQVDDPTFAAYDYVALCDLDLAFRRGLEAWAGDGDIAAKPVDYPNPPLEVLDRLYAAAGLAGRPDVVACTHAAGSATYANNCNGGVYILRAGIVSNLGRAWKKWALWALERGDLIGAHIGHVDQISFGLAAWDLGLAVRALPVEANMPTHAPPEHYPAGMGPPAVLHYHDRLATDDTLMPVGIEVIDECIRSVNEVLLRRRRDAPA
jgi:hypothetical protein